MKPGESRILGYSDLNNMCAIINRMNWRDSGEDGNDDKRNQDGIIFKVDEEEGTGTRIKKVRISPAI